MGFTVPLSVPEQLLLKVGARVMLHSQHQRQICLVNGMLGRVKHINPTMRCITTTPDQPAPDGITE